MKTSEIQMLSAQLRKLSYKRFLYNLFCATLKKVKEMKLVSLFLKEMSWAKNKFVLVRYTSCSLDQNP